MDIIHSASPLKAFSGSIIMTIIFLVLSLVGILPALFARKDKVIKRLANGFLGTVLLLSGIIGVVITYREFQSGDKTVSVQVLEKDEVTRKCNESYCTYYEVETTDGQKYYRFGLDKKVWQKIDVDSCYEFTYYPAQSLLGEYLQEGNEYYDLHETTGVITLIEQVGCR
ncbi:MAG: hypothetical protein HYU84_11100 [Chloroflexi bacterium]|nr:hypothetical protein [Chloroflexota bacterium]